MSIIVARFGIGPAISPTKFLIMLNHSCQVPSNKILTWTARTWAILLSGIFIALAVAPRLAADTAPTFTSATGVTFPQGIQDSFTITTTADPVARITSSGHLPGGVKFVDNGDGPRLSPADRGAVRGWWEIMLSPSQRPTGFPRQRHRISPSPSHGRPASRA